MTEEELNRQWSTDNQKVAEMEFYLVDDLECDLVVFHPYRTLLALCKEANNLGKKERLQISVLGRTQVMDHGIWELVKVSLNFHQALFKLHGMYAFIPPVRKSLT